MKRILQKGIVVAVLIAFSLSFFRLGSVKLFDVDEAVFSEATKEMVESGDWCAGGDRLWLADLSGDGAPFEMWNLLQVRPPGVAASCPSATGVSSPRMGAAAASPCVAISSARVADEMAE